LGYILQSLILLGLVLFVQPHLPPQLESLYSFLVAWSGTKHPANEHIDIFLYISTLASFAQHFSADRSVVSADSVCASGAADHVPLQRHANVDGLKAYHHPSYLTRFSTCF